MQVPASQVPQFCVPQPVFRLPQVQPTDAQVDVGVHEHCPLASHTYGELQVPQL
jgi:hypothetical protein